MPLHDSVGRWISVVYRQSQVHLDRALADHGLSSGQVGFLAVLYEGDGLSQTELTERLRIDKGTTAEALARLERAAFIHRVPDPDDRRVKRVHLTPRAVEFRPTFVALLEDWVAVLTRGLTVQEERTALDLLRRMADNAAEALGWDGLCCFAAECPSAPPLP